LGRFDVVFFFGVVYHLRHPLLALDKLAAACDGRIFVESAILDDFSPYRGGMNKGYPGGQMVMEFYPDKQYGNNDTNWWVPTVHCLAHMVRAAGFTRDIKAWKLVEQPTQLPHCRGFVSASK
jgi:tRNA (mo5U34)-methyltransferase